MMQVSRIVFAMPGIFVSNSAFAADYLTVIQAQKILFPEADKFQEYKVTLTEGQLNEIKTLAQVRQRSKTPSIWKVEKKGVEIGWFFVDEVVGKHEFITYAVAVSASNETMGVEILSYRETHGGEIRDEIWRRKFKGKKLSDPFKLDVDVPNISGATLSCRNVLDGVKRLLVLKKVLSNG